MEKYISSTKAYIEAHKQQVITGGIIGGVLLVFVVITLGIYFSTPRVVYQPPNACDLFTLDEAKSLLGDKAIQTNVTKPEVSGDVGMSRCGYTDANPQTENMIVAAMILRSGVNDDGVAMNKEQFAAGRPKSDTETITSVGDSAYFNKKNGQLNVLKGKNWYVFSYGMASDLASNTPESTVALAKKVVD